MAASKKRVTKAARESFNPAKAVAEVDASRAQLVKTTVQTFSPREDSNAAQYPDEAERHFTGVGAIEPGYSPYVLLTLLEHSNSLRQCVDSYVTNIDAFGHRFEPIIDLNAADADDRVKAYLFERAAEAHPDVIDDPQRQLPEPTVDEIDACKKELRERMRAELHQVEQFFEYACLDISFVTLRRRTRQDLESLGNAYWECIRTEAGRLAGFEYVPGFTVRHMPADHYPTEVEVRVKKNEFQYATVKVRRYFRRFVQCFESRIIFFKEFGDPRLVSARTGQIFRTEKEWLDHLSRNRDDRLATEMLHFRVHTAKSSYGIPRWVGTLLSVLGSRQAEEVNHAYFENKSVPPLALLVSGGRVSDETITRIRDFIENEVKGKQNFHKLLVLEAESGGGGGAGGFDQGRLKMDLKPLTAAQHNDALFQNYDERNIDKVGMAFRLPRMLRGDIRDFNRATAQAALEFAETQVFAPERDEFDFLINRHILPQLGVRFWRFKSNAASTQNPNDLAEIAKVLGEAGYLTPAEGRDLAERILNRQLQKINAPWVKQPIQLTLQGIAPPGDLAAPNLVSPQQAASGNAGAPLGGAAMADANGPVIPTAPADAGSSGGDVNITGTDAASVVTVNEARASMGLGPLKTADGQDDPDGHLTIAEFKAKRQAFGQTTGQAEAGGGTAAGLANVPGLGKGDMSTGDLAQGGLALPAQGGRRRREDEEKSLLPLAAQLLALRRATLEAEVLESQEAFKRMTASEEELAKDDDAAE